MLTVKDLIERLQQVQDQGARVIFNPPEHVGKFLVLDSIQLFNADLEDDEEPEIYINLRVF